jgi:hypothetical protein
MAKSDSAFFAFAYGSVHANVSIVLGKYLLVGSLDAFFLSSYRHND